MYLRRFNKDRMKILKKWLLFEDNIDAIMGLIDVDMLKNGEKMSSAMNAICLVDETIDAFLEASRYQLKDL